MGRCKIALTPTEHCVSRAVEKRRKDRVRKMRSHLPAEKLEISLMLLPAEDPDFFAVAEAVDMSYSKVKTLYYGYGPWKEV